MTGASPPQERQWHAASTASIRSTWQYVFFPGDLRGQNKIVAVIDDDRLACVRGSHALHNEDTYSTYRVTNAQAGVCARITGVPLGATR